MQKIRKILRAVSEKTALPTNQPTNQPTNYYQQHQSYRTSLTPVQQTIFFHEMNAISFLYHRKIEQKFYNSNWQNQFKMKTKQSVSVLVEVWYRFNKKWKHMLVSWFQNEAILYFFLRAFPSFASVLSDYIMKIRVPY